MHPVCVNVAAEFSDVVRSKDNDPYLFSAIHNVVDQEYSSVIWTTAVPD